MAEAASVRESVTIAGRPERVAVARAFAAAVLGGQHPEGDTAVLLLSELVTKEPSVINFGRVADASARAKLRVSASLQFRSSLSTFWNARTRNTNLFPDAY